MKLWPMGLILVIHPSHHAMMAKHEENVILSCTDDLQSGEVEYFSTHKMGNFLESGEFPRFHGTFDKI